jgi:O-antigen/teichoic acid export membrane protein
LRSLSAIVARNSVFATFSQLALKIVTFAFSVYVVRRLGGENFGQYSAVMAFVGIFAIFSELGIVQYAIREIARDRSKATYFLWNHIFLRVILSIGVILGTTALAALVGYSPFMVLAIFVASCGLLLQSVAGTLEVILWGTERVDISSVLAVVNQLAFVILGTIVLVTGHGVIALVLASFGGVLASILLSVRFIRKHKLCSFAFQLAPRDWWKLIRTGIPFGIITFTMLLSFKVDTVFLSLWKGDEVTGWYNVAYNLIFTFSALAVGFKGALTPSMSREYKSDPERVARWYRASMRFVYIFFIPITVGVALLSGQIVRFLYTEAYAPSAPALRILIWVLPLMMITDLSGSIGTVTLQEQRCARIRVVNAVFNILLNLIAIPRYGLMGAAVVTVLTEVVGAAQFVQLLRRDVQWGAVLQSFVRPTLAAITMGTVVFLARDLYLPLVVAIGALTYLASLLLLGEISASEVRTVRTALAQRMR